MGLRKLKKYKKQFTVLTRTYNFSEPIQVLVDANTVLEADRINYNLVESINLHIPYDTRLFISDCCIQNLYKSKNERAIAVAKQMQKRFCYHKETLPSRECIQSLVDHKGENKFRFVVVTQNDKLRDDLRKLPAMPMFFIKKGVLVMEPLSKTTKKIAQYVNAQKLTTGLNSLGAGKRAAPGAEPAGSPEDLDSPGADAQGAPPKKRKVKGVNPLAMKKKQARPTAAAPAAPATPTGAADKKPRRRRHKKPAGEADQTNRADQTDQTDQQAQSTPVGAPVGAPAAEPPADPAAETM